MERKMAIVVKNPKLTFIHIPKTAGVTVSRILKMDYGGQEHSKSHGGKHSNLSKVKKQMGPDLGYTVAVIRNPWDRLVSAYFYYVGRKKIGPSKISFEQFVYKKASIGWGCCKVHQHTFFEVDEMSLIARFENLEEDLKPMWYYLNENAPAKKNRKGDLINREIPNMNRQFNNSKRDKDYRGYYNSKMIDYVSEICKVDIELFNYKFE